MRRLATLVIAVGLVAVGACGGSSSTPTLAGQVRTPLPEVGALSLPDASGKPFAFTAPAGDVLLVYFGYTSCPDVCPTTMSEIRTTLRQLGAKADKVHLAMITVDPDRDSPKNLLGYVRSFVPTADALVTTDAATLKTVGDAFGAEFSVTRNAAGDVEVSHSAFVYAVDQQGHIRVQWPFGTHAKEFAGDLRWLLDDIAKNQPTKG